MFTLMFTHFLVTLATLSLAVLLDRVFGEPTKAHPLIIFGRYANKLENAFNLRQQQQRNVLRGFYGWLLAVAPVTLAAIGLINFITWLFPWSLVSLILDALVLYLCIGWRSLKEHMQAIHRPLIENDIESARYACSMVVSRNTGDLNAQQIARATVESTLENGSDGIFGAIFWFALLGIPGVIMYRLSNTLDAMWGYHNEQFETFGKWAARWDDLINWVPARITALLYAFAPKVNPSFCGDRDANAIFVRARTNWNEQAPHLASPNGGPVMITGATVLDVRLGGPATYHGTLVDKPYFGGDKPVSVEDIPKALTLIDTTLYSWVIVGAAISLLTLI